MAEDGDIESALIPSLYKPSALLPIAQLKDQLLYTIETYPVTIVVGETGSGNFSRSMLNEILVLTLFRQDNTNTKISSRRRLVQQRPADSHHPASADSMY